MQNFYKAVAKANKLLLPSLTKQRVDLAKAKKWQLALFAYKLWIVKKALD